MPKKGFVLAPVNSILVNVKFTIPTDVGKPEAKGDLDVRYRLRSVTDQREYMSELHAETKRLQEEADGDIWKVTRDLDDDCLKADIMDIKGLVDVNGKEIEFSAEILLTLLDMDNIRTALLDGWKQVNFGSAIKEAKRKN